MPETRHDIETVNTWDGDSALDLEFTRPNIAGDSRDDDAAVVNSLVESHAEPPSPEQRPHAKVDVPLTQPVKKSRLLSTTFVVPVASAWDPIQAQPADAKRMHLIIVVVSTVATDYIRFADDKDKLAFLSSSHILPVGRHVISDFTGHAWFGVPDATGALTVSFASVTE